MESIAQSSIPKSNCSSAKQKCSHYEVCAKLKPARAARIGTERWLCIAGEPQDAVFFRNRGAGRDVQRSWDRVRRATGEHGFAAFFMREVGTEAPVKRDAGRDART